VIKTRKVEDKRMNIIETVVSFADARGEIIDLVENEVINAVTIVTFRKGSVRGNHYHKNTKQWNYLLSGKIKLVCQTPGAEVKEVEMKEGDFVLTLPDERHALLGLEDSRLLVLTHGPRGGKDYETDTFRLENPLIPQG
jgi:oxalate decarboxylase/phosphoglucose isomerase-like protein (cupin superfamily)